MKTANNILASRLLRLFSPCEKRAYTVLGAGGGEFDSEGRRMSYGTNSSNFRPVEGYRPKTYGSYSGGHTYGQTPGYGGGDYSERVARNQSEGRARLGNQWIASQGFGDNSDPYGVYAQRRKQQAAFEDQNKAFFSANPNYRQYAGMLSRNPETFKKLQNHVGWGWQQQNAGLLEQNPELRQHAGYFSRNPEAWTQFQRDSGIGQAAAPASPAQAPARPQVQQPAQAGQQSAGSPAPVSAPHTPQPADAPQQPSTPSAPQQSQRGISIPPEALTLDEGGVSQVRPTAPQQTPGVVEWSPGQNLPGMNAQETAAHTARANATQQQTKESPEARYARGRALLNSGKFTAYGGSTSGVFRPGSAPSAGTGGGANPAPAQQRAKQPDIDPNYKHQVASTGGGSQGSVDYRRWSPALGKKASAVDLVSVLRSRLLRRMV